MRPIDSSHDHETAVVSIGLVPRRVVRMMAWMLLGLIAINVAAVVIVRTSGGVHGLVTLRTFDFRQEGNVPTYFSALLFLACAMALYLNGRLAVDAVATRRWRWYALACVFVFLSIDDAAQFHEQISRFRLGFQGSWAFLDERSWTVFYTAGVAALGLFYLPWMWRLPRRTMCGFLLSGTLFVLFKVGFDNLSVYLASHGSLLSLTAKGADEGTLLSLAEEWLKVAAILLFLHVLLGHAFRHRRAVILRLENPPAVPG